VDEDVLAAVLRHDEAVAFRGIEPFDCPGSHNLVVAPLSDPPRACRADERDNRGMDILKASSLRERVPKSAQVDCVVKWRRNAPKCQRLDALP
jgi:hypothetical protein